MGTRSLTVFKDGQEELAVLYRQFDGYPTGHGLELAEFLAGIKVVNGIPMGGMDRLANGAGCLAVQVIHYLKQKEAYDPCKRSYGGGAGGLYLYKAGTRDAGEEWTYVLTCLDGQPEIQVAVWDGEEEKSDLVFAGPADDFYRWCVEQKEEQKRPLRPYVNRASKTVKQIEVVEVDSRSNPGEKHKVARLSNGEVVCTCKGFEHRKTCRHLKEAGF